jgi:hypothetical protein
MYDQAFEFGVRQLWNIEFISIMSLSASKPIPIDMRSDGQTWTVMSASIAGASRSPIQVRILLCIFRCIAHHITCLV